MATILTLLSCTLLSLSLVNADPSALLSPYVLHERRTHTPSGWKQSHKASPNTILPLRFGLTQSNIANIEDLLNDVAHPDSPNYGNHWTAAQIAQTFAPSKETIDTVREWLLWNGFDEKRVKVTKTKSWIEVNATVEEAEELLRTDYHVYAHDSGKEHIGTGFHLPRISRLMLISMIYYVVSDSYHLPAHIVPHIEIITPSVHFNAIIAKRRTGSSSAHDIGQPGVGITPKTTGRIETLLTELEDCDKQITPICLRALYGLIYEPLSPHQNSYGIGK